MPKTGVAQRELCLELVSDLPSPEKGLLLGSNDRPESSRSE